MQNFPNLVEIILVKFLSSSFLVQPDKKKVIYDN